MLLFFFTRFLSRLYYQFNFSIYSMVIVFRIWHKQNDDHMACNGSIDLCQYSHFYQFFIFKVHYTYFTADTTCNSDPFLRFCLIYTLQAIIVLYFIFRKRQRQANVIFLGLHVRLFRLATKCKLCLFYLSKQQNERNDTFYATKKHTDIYTNKKSEKNDC